MVMCPYHGLTYVSHGKVALPSLLVDPVEAAVVLPEFPPRPPPLLLFLPSLPPVGRSHRYGTLSQLTESRKVLV
jgi:hypothetical protein